MDNVKGVYVVLYGGFLFASLLGGIESCFYCCKRSRETKVFDNWSICNVSHSHYAIILFEKVLATVIKILWFQEMGEVDFNMGLFAGSVQKRICRRDEIYSEVRK